MFRSKLCIVLILYCHSVSSLRILGIFPHVGESHFRVFKPLVLGLVDKGHDVTVISHFPSNDTKYKDISLKSDKPITQAWLLFDNFTFFGPTEKIMRHVASARVLSILSDMSCKFLVTNEKVRGIEQGDFDVVLLEHFNTDCALGIVHKLKVPFIGITSHFPMPFSMERVGMINHPAYVPSHFLAFGNKPNLLETLESLLVSVFYNFFYRHYHQIPEQKLLKQYIAEDTPDLGELAKNMSLLLINTYYPLFGALSLPPNVVEIGGVHLHYKLNSTLDNNYQKLLDESNEGVLLFSMGSRIRGVSWPKERLEVFKKVFARLPYKVLWKWENETMENMPANVIISEWIPQFDALRHKNVIGFITHGGSSGIIEAIHAGVPLVVVPLYGDQFCNGAAVRSSGLGIVLDIKNITEESLSWGLNEILNPRVRENAKRLSLIWRDRPRSPMEIAIFWIEHVAKYGGAHIRSLGADLPMTRYFLIDVIGVLVFFVSTAIVLVYLLLKCCFKRLLNQYFGKQKTE